MNLEHPIRYTVIAEFDDASVAEEGGAWLRDGHLADVIDAGAIDAEVVAIETEADAPAVVEVRYRFADRTGLDRYFERDAPRLRAEGIALFPTERGIRYRRSIGEVACRRGA
ncbi:MAG: DUF4286 family protein [Phycisphaerales bacterium]